MPNLNFTHLMIGLRETGKTTFLAAFWHIVQNTDVVPGALQLASVRGDRTYLNTIEQRWMAALPIERTKVAGQPVTIRVRHPGSGQEMELSIPDMSGEMYEDVQWGRRECPAEYAALAASAAGALLFVHPDATGETDSIAQAEGVLTGLANDPQPPQQAELSEPQAKAIPWNPKRTPTQVKLVELLQFFLSHTRPPVRLGIVVSAWDRVGGRRMTPERWLAERVPLLDQFLAANDDRMVHQAFGVSAQGGPLSNADSLRAHSDPANRIRVVGPAGESNDITVPVKWLMAAGRTEA